MKKLLLALGIALLAWNGPVVAGTEVYDGRINVIGEDHIVLKVGDRTMTLELARFLYQHGFKTEYLTEFGYPTTYETLYGAGFVERARVHVKGGVVSRLEVLRLQPE